MSDYFNEITGTNEYERQSWRDNFNGGRAAGDWTGNTNARLDREREAFQGATWTGSSTQYSALEVAQQSAGVGQPTTGQSASSGSGNSGFVQGENRPDRPAGGSGPGTGSGFTGPLEIGVKESGTELLYGGSWWASNPWVSDTEEWEARYGEPGDWLGGIAVFAADALFNAGRALDWGFGFDLVSNNRPDTSTAASDWFKAQRAGEGAWPEIRDAFGRQMTLWTTMDEPDPVSWASPRNGGRGW